MEKIKKYILENKAFLAIMILGFIMLFVQMNQVVLYADDFSLGFYVKPFADKNLWKYFIEHYTTWGGGYTGVAVIILFKIGLFMWKILNTLLITLMVGFGTKMITYKSENKKSKSLVALIMWICVFLIGIYVSKECIYWLDGSVAYVLAAFELFIFTYAIYSKIIMKLPIKKYDYVLLPILGIFAGWSSAQTSAMSLIVAAFIIIYAKIKNKEKINKVVWVAVITAIIGAMIFYLSPGNSGRMEKSENFKDLSIPQKIEYRADRIYGLFFNYKTYEIQNTAGLSFYTFVMLGMISAIGIQMASKDENNKKKWILQILNALVLAFLAVNLIVDLKIINTETIKEKFLTFTNLYEASSINLVTLLPYVSASAVMLISVITSISIGKKEQNPLLFIFIVTGYLIQGIMVMAPYSPLRTTLVTILFFILAIGYLLHIAVKEEYSILLAMAVPLAIYNIYLGILLVMLAFSIDNMNVEISKNMKSIIAVIIIFGMASLFNWYQTYMGYRQNKRVYEENISRIESFVNENPTKESQKDKEILLLKSSNDVYEFTPMVGYGWIEDAIKSYFDLDYSVTLKEQEANGGTN